MMRHIHYYVICLSLILLFSNDLSAQACGATIDPVSPPAGAPTDQYGNFIACSDGTSDAAYIQPNPPSGSLPNNEYIVEFSNGNSFNINSDASWDTQAEGLVAGDTVYVTGFTYDLDSINGVLDFAWSLCPILDNLLPDVQPPPCGPIGDLVMGVNDGMPGLQSLDEAIALAGSFGGDVSTVDSAVNVLNSLNATIGTFGAAVCFDYTETPYAVVIADCTPPCEAMAGSVDVIDPAAYCQGSSLLDLAIGTSGDNTNYPFVTAYVVTNGAAGGYIIQSLGIDSWLDLPPGDYTVHPLNFDSTDPNTPADFSALIGQSATVALDLIDAGWCADLGVTDGAYDVTVLPEFDAQVTEFVSACISDGTIELSGSPAGGEWFDDLGNSYPNGNVDLVNLGLGNYQIFYSVGDYSTGVCNDIDTVNIEVLSASFSGEMVSFCTGNDFVLPDGTVVNTPGVYESILVASNGCDSIVTIDLSELPNITNSLSEDICEGETFELPDGTVTGDAGTYDFVYQAITGCDSTVILTLNVIDCTADCPTTLTAEASAENICSGETVTFSALIDQYDAEFEWTNMNGASFDPDQGIALNNPTCNLLTMSFTVVATCLDDTSITLTESVSVNVYPADIGAFVTAVPGGCVATVAIDPSCNNLVFESFNAAPGESGTASITVSWATDETACVDDAVVEVDYDCPQDIICPTTLETSVSDDELCCTEAVTFSASVDQGDANYTWTNMLGDVVDPNNLMLENNTCDPLEMMFFVEANCVQDFNQTLSGEVAVVVYPCDISQFVTVEPSADGCSASLVVSDDCSFVSGDSYTAAPGESGTITLTATYSGPGEDCIEDVEIPFDVDCPPNYYCDIADLEVTASCAGQNNAQVTVSFTGSNIYTISDGTTNWSGLTAGTYTYDGYANDELVTITVTDELFGYYDCSLTADPVSANCDPANCNSQAGTIMAQSNQYLCEGDAAIVDADDFILQPSQSVYYVYHTAGPDISQADLPLDPTDVIQFGSFLVNGADVSGTVYVTAFGATAAGNGGPDFNDVCITISNTIEINFLDPISIVVEEDCDTGSGEFSYTFTITGGLPQAVAGETYFVTGDYFNGDVAYNDPVTVGPILDGESYAINVEDANNCTGDFSAMIQCEKLPVELIAFNGSAETEGNLIKWVTASEIENDYFTLYASQDGINFSEIHIEAGQGTTSSISYYEFMDRNAESGVTYYQLKQTDFDGTTSTTQIITVQRGEIATVQINILGNPVESALNININVPSENEVNIEIVDLNGKTIESRVLNLTAGNNVVSFDVNYLAQGIYVLSVQNGDFIENQRFIKN